jgi:hypothetical protein
MEAFAIITVETLTGEQLARVQIFDDGPSVYLNPHKALSVRQIDQLEDALAMANARYDWTGEK